MTPSTSQLHVDFKSNRYPFCLVWTPIPLITWLFPFIGHMGIADSSGYIRDFAGSHMIGEGKLSFGDPTRYLSLNPNMVVGESEAWDLGIKKACEIYSNRVHNLILDNCHSHCATALCHMNYKNYSKWNMGILAIWMFVCGKYVGVSGFLKTWAPFGALLATIIVIFNFSN